VWRTLELMTDSESTSNLNVVDRDMDYIRRHTDWSDHLKLCLYYAACQVLPLNHWVDNWQNQCGECVRGLEILRLAVGFQ
jgi:hypothetical protein